VPLKEDFTLYFSGLDGTTLMRVDELVPTKRPESQPASVDMAEARMVEAATGLRPKRRPITVQCYRDTGHVLVVDGNATFGAATRNAWVNLPVVFEPEADAPSP